MWILVGCVAPVPAARLDGVAVTDLDLGGASAEVRVVVDNPLPVDLPLAGLAWELEVDGHRWAEGRSAPGAVVPARGSAVVALPVAVRWAELGTGGGAEVTVVWRAALTLAGPLGDLTVPLSWTATTPRFDGPALTVEDTTLGLDHGDLVLGLALRVDLPLGLEPSALSWSATAGRVRLGSGVARVGDGGRLLLPVAVDPSAVGALTAHTLLGGTTEVVVRADGSVSTPVGEVPLRLERVVVVP